MIKIKMITTSAGPEGCHKPNEVYDENEDTAKALVNGGYAEYVEPPIKDGEKIEPKANNSTNTGPSFVGRNERVSKGGRK